MRFATPATLVLLVCSCDDSRIVAFGLDPDAAAVSGDAAGDAAGDGGGDAAGSSGTPRLIAPLSTSTVTQQRPTLRWTGALVGSPTVDLCLDRACTQPLAVGVAITGSTAVADAPLPPGWIFWRVRTATQTTPTWQFWVGTASASNPVDTSTGSTLDINGDGYADLLIGGAQLGAAYVYLGNGLPRIDLTPVDVLNCGDCFGSAVANVGDVNGDGFADFFVGAENHLYFGGANVDGSSWNGPSAPGRIDGGFIIGAYGQLGKPVGAGDVNGDGYADFLIPFNRAEGGFNLYLGEATPGGDHWQRIVIDDPDQAWPKGPLFGVSAAGAGDLNGDGYADFIIGARASDYCGSPPSCVDDADNVASQLAFAHVYLGAPAPTDSDWNDAVAARRIDLPGLHPEAWYGGLYGSAVSSAGDVNGDGYTDFVVGAMYASTNTIGYAGMAHLYLGSPTPVTADWIGTSPTRRIDLEGPVGMAELGLSAVPAGDVNADGYADFVVGEMDNQSVQQYGGARLYLGDPSASVANWNGAAPPKRIDLPTPDGSYGGFANSLAGAGDIDGDGYADFVVSAAHVAAGRAHVYHGEAVLDATHWNGASPSRRVDVANPTGTGHFGMVR